MLAGMIALTVTFLIPFVAYLISGANFSRRVEARSVEHTRERLAQLAEELRQEPQIHKLTSQGEPTRRAA